jgi:hypothetical protein
MESVRQLLPRMEVALKPMVNFACRLDLQVMAESLHGANIANQRRNGIYRKYSGCKYSG